MSRAFIRNLADGREFYLLLQAKPPRVVHWSAVLSVAMLITGLVWAGATRVDLVVRAPGRVRPLSPPVPVRMGARAEILSASLGGHVVQVNFSPGQTVRRHDVLVRLDTERLDVEMARKRHTLANLEKETEELERQRGELTQELGEANKRAQAELLQAEESLKQRKVRQESDIRTLQREEAKARDEMKLRHAPLIVLREMARHEKQSMRRRFAGALTSAVRRSTSPNRR